MFFVDRQTFSCGRQILGHFKSNMPTHIPDLLKVPKYTLFYFQTSHYMIYMYNSMFGLFGIIGRTVKWGASEITHSSGVRLTHFAIHDGKCRFCGIIGLTWSCSCLLREASHRWTTEPADACPDPWYYTHTHTHTRSWVIPPAH